MTTITTTLDCLTVGDVVQCHGARLRLTALLGSGERDPATGNAAHDEPSFRCFASKYLGDVSAKYPTQIPAHWLKVDKTNPHGFVVQSNNRAKWAAETPLVGSTG